MAKRNGPSQLGPPLRPPINVRLSDNVAAGISIEAKKADLSDSAYISQILAEHVGRVETQHTQPVQRYGAASSPDIVALNNLRGELARQGGLLIQEAKAARESASSHHPALEKLIVEIAAAIESVKAMQTYMVERIHD